MAFAFGDKHRMISPGWLAGSVHVHSHSLVADTAPADMMACIWLRSSIMAVSVFFFFPLIFCLHGLFLPTVTEEQGFSYMHAMQVSADPMVLAGTTGNSQ